MSGTTAPWVFLEVLYNVLRPPNLPSVFYHCDNSATVSYAQSPRYFYSPDNIDGKHADIKYLLLSIIENSKFKQHTFYVRGHTDDREKYKNIVTTRTWPQHINILCDKMAKEHNTLHPSLLSSLNASDLLEYDFSVHFSGQPLSFKISDTLHKQASTNIPYKSSENQNINSVSKWHWYKRYWRYIQKKI